MKKQVDTLDATPSKRLFLSIIADYDLNRSICELVDNALDVWVRGGRSSSIEIEISISIDQKTISVSDNAGGRMLRPGGPAQAGAARGLQPEGLAIAQSVASLHGGSLSVQSLPGAGSEVSLRLPRRAASPLAVDRVATGEVCR